MRALCLLPATLQLATVLPPGVLPTKDPYSGGLVRLLHWFAVESSVQDAYNCMARYSVRRKAVGRPFAVFRSHLATWLEFHATALMGCHKRDVQLWWTRHISHKAQEFEVNTRQHDAAYASRHPSRRGTGHGDSAVDRPLHPPGHSK